jgi:macrolide transport system ATP-binding/permease protein
MLKLTNISKRYQMGDNLVQALDGVSLTVESGDFVAIMGPSGSGKSTLMHVMGLLDGPDEGSYQINGKEVSKLSEDELAVLRRKVIGFIFQQFNLLPRMTALENVSLPLFYSEGQMNPERARELLAMIGLGDRVEHHSNELSGGQQQRVAIARALVNRPILIFADEPTGNLDSKSEKEVIGALKRLNDTGITIVIVTHEEEIGIQAKRLIRMRDGVIQSDERLMPLKSDRDHLKAAAEEKEVVSHSPGKRLKGVKLFVSDVIQHFQQGFKTLGANKVRTALSMLGILIGVAAVVAMLALGRGAQTAIEEQLSSLGSNLLVVRPGATRVSGGAKTQAGTTTRLTVDDAIAIKEKIYGASESAPNVQARAQVSYLNKNWNTQVIGVTSPYFHMHATDPDVGRAFTDDETKKRARVAVIGRTLVRELFGEVNPIGEMVKINKVSFQVIGVLPEKGANGFQDQDDKIVIPVLTAMYRLMGKAYVDFIDVQISDPNLSEGAEDQIQALMMERHHVGMSQNQQDDAFQIRNMADIQAALTNSTRVMTLLLSVIAAISLVVGGIGIMNIMLVSVTERTREIGLRKAVGARRADILMQFLIEAVVVSSIGGLLGILLAWIVTTVLSTVAGWATSISIASVLLAFFFSAGVGVVFGIYPARRASLLHPIDALRYE